MSRRFSVTAAALFALVALAGCGSPEPGSVQSPAAPSALVTASPSATAAASPPTSAPPGTQAAGPIDVQDVSFVSAGQGWALGSRELVTTTDGAASWTRLPGPPAGAAHIRFASPEVGYAWSTAGPLWITTDGAASWRPGGLTQVLSLETAAGQVWSIAGAQPYPDIWRAPAGSTAWRNLGLTPDRSATLTVHSDVAYVVGQQGAGPIAPSLDVFAGTQQVRHESLPCVQGQAYVPFASLGVSTDGLVYLVCDVMNNQPSPPAQTQLAYESVNQGSSWRAGQPTAATATAGRDRSPRRPVRLELRAGPVHAHRARLASLADRPRARFLPGRVRNEHARRGPRHQRPSVDNPQRRHQLEPGHHLTDARCGPWPAHPGSAVRVTHGPASSDRGQGRAPQVRQDPGHATSSVGSRQPRQPRTEADGKPVTQSNPSLRALAQRAAYLGAFLRTLARAGVVHIWVYLRGSRVLARVSFGLLEARQRICE